MHNNHLINVLLLLLTFYTFFGFGYYVPIARSNNKIKASLKQKVTNYRQSTSFLSSTSSIIDNIKLPKLPTVLIQHLPNILTVARVIAIFPFVTFFVQDQKTIASGIYALACLTDLFDGWIARKFNVISKFGAFLDPVADKVILTFMSNKILISTSYNTV